MMTGVYQIALQIAGALGYLAQEANQAGLDDLANAIDDVRHTAVTAADLAARLDALSCEAGHAEPDTIGGATEELRIEAFEAARGSGRLLS